MKNYAIIGAGDVAKSAAIKLMKVSPKIQLHLISRSQRSLEVIRELIGISGENTPLLKTVDVYDNKESLAKYLAEHSVEVVVNLASPYTDIAVMEACLEANCHYLDTACYEAKDTKGFSYKQQLKYFEAFKNRGLTALLGAGGSPGITNHLVVRAIQELPKKPKHIRIFDGNAGGQDKYKFATNFSAEDNIKELDNPSKHYEKGQWVSTPPFSLCVKPGDGLSYYRIFHEEQETLQANFPNVEKIENFMSFSKSYLNYFSVLKDVGLFNIKPVLVEGNKVIPLKLLASLLPSPSKTAPLLKGKAYMTVEVTDVENNQVSYRWTMDHQQCFADTHTGAVAWSTGVPAIMFADLLPLIDSGVLTPEQIPVSKIIALYELFTININRLK